MKKITVKPAKSVSDFKELVRTSYEKFTSKTFYEYKVGKQIHKYSYTRLYNELNAYGTALVSRGFKGKTIAVVGETSPFWTLTYLAITTANGIIVPLDSELSLDAMCDFINIAKCEAIAYTGKFNGVITKLCDKLPDVSLFIRLTPDENNEDNFAPDKTVDIQTLLDEGEKLLSSGDTSYTSIECDREKCCSILFTSGTTGTSKGVMLSQKNICTSINASSSTVPCDDSTSLVSVLPVHHTYEFTTTHLSGMNIGASIYINPSLKYASRSMQYFKPTTIAVVPLFIETVHKKVWAKINDEKIDKKVKFGMILSNAALKLGVDIRKKLFADIQAAFGGNISSLICGGAPIQAKIMKDFYSFGIPIYEGYGITECSPLVSVNPYTAPRIGSVGKPVPGTQVKIDEAGRDDMGRGEILVRGDNVMLGYYNNPEATKEVFTDDGWFRTGDIGYIDNDGYIFITGRKKNVIILSNGKNVYPEEIEEKLSSEYVKEIVVIGRKDESGNETEIIAIVYPNFEGFENLTPDEVKAEAQKQLDALNAELPSFKQASKIEFRDCEFEKTTTKKIKRYLVK